MTIRISHVGTLGLCDEYCHVLIYGGGGGGGSGGQREIERKGKLEGDMEEGKERERVTKKG